MFILAVAAALLVQSITAFAAGPPAAPPDAVAYIARDYSFEGPEKITSGWKNISLRNEGKEPHQLQFIKLPDGRTAEDFRAAVTADPSRLPRWAQRRSGPNSIASGEQAQTIVQLEAGEYVVFCGIPDAENVPHVVRGMVKAVRVEAAAKPAEQPTADLTLALADFGFDLPQPVKAGVRTIRIVNKGGQAHEAVIVKLSPQGSVADYLDAYKPGVASSAAGKPVGGLSGIDAGREGFVRIDLQPGRYGLICFLADFLTRSPHFARGMMLDFEVH